MENIRQVFLSILSEEVESVADMRGEVARVVHQQGVEHPQPLLGQLLLLGQETKLMD